MKYETCDVESDYKNGEKLAVALKLEFAYLESQETSGQKMQLVSSRRGCSKLNGESSLLVRSPAPTNYEFSVMLTCETR